MCRWRGWNKDFCSYPQSERSKRARNGTRATPEHWWGCRNTFRPVITVPRERSIKRAEDPPRWHLESLHTAALINQTVSGLNMASLKTPQYVANVWNNRGTLQREGYSQILSAGENVTLPTTMCPEPRDQRQCFCFPLDDMHRCLCCCRVGLLLYMLLCCQSVCQ